jgi:hypothetical protein
MAKKLIFILLLYIGYNSYGQTNTVKLATIKNYIENINADKTLTTLKCNHTDFKSPITDGIETLYGYYEDGILVKIKHVQEVSPATQIFKIIHFKNNQVVAYRNVTQVHEYNEEKQQFNTEWKTTTDIKLFFNDGVIIELTAKGDNDISMHRLKDNMQNKIKEYKNMLLKK